MNFPRHVHRGRVHNRRTKIVQNADEYKAAVADGWQHEPKSWADESEHTPPVDLDALDDLNADGSQPAAELPKGKKPKAKK